MLTAQKVQRPRGIPATISPLSWHSSCPDASPCPLPNGPAPSPGTMHNCREHRNPPPHSILRYSPFWLVRPAHSPRPDAPIRLPRASPGKTGRIVMLATQMPQRSAENGPRASRGKGLEFLILRLTGGKIQNNYLHGATRRRWIFRCTLDHSLFGSSKSISLQHCASAWRMLRRRSPSRARS
jgi:hypothetical protein